MTLEDRATAWLEYFAGRPDAFRNPMCDDGEQLVRDLLAERTSQPHSLTAQLLREIAERIRLRCPGLLHASGKACDECMVDAADLERIAADLQVRQFPEMRA